MPNLAEERTRERGASRGSIRRQRPREALRAASDARRQLFSIRVPRGRNPLRSGLSRAVVRAANASRWKPRSSTRARFSLHAQRLSRPHDRRADRVCAAHCTRSVAPSTARSNDLRGPKVIAHSCSSLDPSTFMPRARSNAESRLDRRLNDRGSSQYCACADSGRLCRRFMKLVAIFPLRPRARFDLCEYKGSTPDPPGWFRSSSSQKGLACRS
jgi:hypothetical protein